jgi:hypothetical protein
VLQVVDQMVQMVHFHQRMVRLVPLEEIMVVEVDVDIPRVVMVVLVLFVLSGVKVDHSHQHVLQMNNK